MNNKENELSTNNLRAVYPTITIYAGDSDTLNNIPNNGSDTADITCPQYECIINYLFTSSAEGVFVSSVQSNGNTDWKVRVSNRSGAPANVTVTPIIFKAQL